MSDMTLRNIAIGVIVAFLVVVSILALSGCAADLIGLLFVENPEVVAS